MCYNLKSWRKILMENGLKGIDETIKMGRREFQSEKGESEGGKG